MIKIKKKRDRRGERKRALLPKPEGYVFGTPTKYRPEYCQMLIDHFSKGLSFKAFAGKVNVQERTLFNWLEQNPDFKTAKEIGEPMARLFWERMGIAGVAGQVKGFNPAGWIFNMKNRFRDDWRDRQEIEHQVRPQIIERPSGEQILLTTEKILLEEEQQGEQQNDTDENNC